MAYTTNDITAPSAVAGVAAAFRRIARHFAENSAGARCAAEAARLSRLSDEELHAMGLTREAIVRHAFRFHMGG